MGRLADGNKPVKRAKEVRLTITRIRGLVSSADLTHSSQTRYGLHAQHQLRWLVNNYVCRTGENPGGWETSKLVYLD